MTKLIAFILFTSCAVGSYSQTVKKEYYDYYKTQIMAEYQVNSVGEKHGWFKGYNQEGIVVNEFNYKNNLWDGVNKEYSTYTGSRTLSQSETYKAGVLNGPAVYYAGDGSNKGRFVKAQGSHKDGERDGDWVLMESFDSYGWPDDIKKAAQFTKGTYNYKSGKIVCPDGQSKTYYYPSGKVESEIYFSGGLKSGEWKYYFPDGSLRGTEKYNELGKPNFLMYYYPNGKLKSKDDWTSGKHVHEGYKENGDLDDVTFMLKQQKEQEERSNAIIKAYKLLGAEQYEVAIKSYNDLGVNTEYLEYFLQLKKEFENKQINHTNFRSQLKTKYWDLEEKKGILTLKSHEEYCLAYVEKIKIEEERILEETNKLNKELQSSLNGYKDLNIVETKTPNIDAAKPPIITNSYLKSKIIYNKSMIVVDSYAAEFNQEKDLEKKRVILKKINDAIVVLNSIPESEWKDLSKQLKKIDDPEQIKSILKI